MKFEEDQDRIPWILCVCVYLSLYTCTYRHKLLACQTRWLPMKVQMQKLQTRTRLISNLETRNYWHFAVQAVLTFMQEQQKQQKQPLTISLSLFQISFHFFCVVFPFPSKNPPLALSLLQGPCHPPPNLQSQARCRRDAQRVHPHWPRKGSRGPNHPSAIGNSISFKISRPKNDQSLPKKYLLALQFGRYVFFSLPRFFEPNGWKIWILTEGDFLPTGSWETRKHPKSPHGRVLCQEVKTSWKKNSKGKEQAGNLHGIPRNQ